MEEKELYGQGQPQNQNQAYSQGQPYTQQQSQPAKAVVYDTMPMKNNNAAIGGLIIGIFALIGCWVPFWNLILAIAGIICSAIGLSHKEKSRGLAIGGLVTSIIGLLISIIFSLIYLAAIALV